MKITIDLKNRNGIIVRATTDEKLYEIEKAIAYNYHGDEFLVVKTKDGHAYRYGFFCGLPSYPQYHELANNPCKFITAPKLYKSWDSEINGVDGEAGKEEFTGRAIYFNAIIQGYNVSAKNVRGKKVRRDEFGLETRVLCNF